MSRLQKYKEFLIILFENLHNGYSIKQMLEYIHKFTETNQGTLDGIAGKTLLCSYFIAVGEFKEADKIIKSLELTGNDLVDFFILETSSLFYSGLNDPTIDYTKAIEIHKQALSLADKIIFQEKWEEVFIKSVELFMEIIFTEDQVEILNLTNKYTEILQTNSELKYFSDFYLNNAAVMYSRIGIFDQALNIFEHCYKIFSKSELSLLYLSNLIKNYCRINDLDQAKKYLSLALPIAKQTENFWLKGLIFDKEALILEYEQRYDDLEINLINHLELAKNALSYTKVSEREFELFSFYLNRFRNTENKTFLEKARKLKDEFESNANKYDDITGKRLNNYATAMLLSLGSLSQKAHAVEIFEELIKNYPNNSSLKLELIDLFWDDLKYDIDGESKKQIDLLLSQLKNLAFINQEVLDNSHISLVILLAKYDFYINKNKDKALDSLYAVQSKAHSFGYKLIEDKLTKEVKLLENDLDWNSGDYSIKERLEKVKFKSYIEGAQIFLDKEP